MGLDMYLSKKTYVKNWDHYSPEEVNEITVKKGGQPHPDIKAERVSYIVEQVGYWRKFNALHQWFVENCQGGRDECQESYVDVSMLEHLLNEVLIPIHEVFKTGDMDNANQIAQDLLPTTSGFFFGGTEYDEWYFENVEQTIELLKGLVEEGGDFFYQSSW